MTGSPLLRLLLVLAGLALLAVPAWRLTARQAPATMPVHAAEKQQPAVAEIELTFTSPIPPSLITVDADGLTIVKSRPESDVTSLRKPVRLPPGGVDLVIKATWPESANPAAKANALRVQATLDGTTLADTTLWGDPDVEDVVTLPRVPKP
jgi:hypothetical protein